MSFALWKAHQLQTDTTLNIGKVIPMRVFTFTYLALMGRPISGVENLGSFDLLNF